MAQYGMQEPRKLRKTSSSSSVEDGVAEPVDPATFARSYQIDAFEMAKKQNTIVFLDTGAGKTLIAVMLVRHYAHYLRKPSDNVAIFLVPTVHLVKQQADVLKMYTDLKVGVFWGEMGVDLWSGVKWKEQLQMYEVLVMTAQILLDNLRHCFFKLEMIKLLIFDECHHAKGRSPYACIMKEFYHREYPLNSRIPRIFGMTASPVNSKGLDSQQGYGNKIQDLETLLNSKVFTTVEESELAAYIPSSNVKLKLYNHVDIPCYLSSSIFARLQDLKLKHTCDLDGVPANGYVNDSVRRKIARLHDTFLFCIQELGVWLAAKAAESLSTNETEIFLFDWMNDEVNKNTVRSFSQDVLEMLSEYIPTGELWHIGSNLKADLDAGLLSGKVHCLIQSLMEYRKEKHLRCIIFVERVITAIVLKELLNQLQKFSIWKTTYMAGNNSCLQSQTRVQQINVVDNFRGGMVNIIVATQILEEGLDVQSCNLVIRYDPSVTVRSFIQSRGRARMPGSDYLLIVESKDYATFRRIDKYLVSGKVMRTESLRRKFDPALPIENPLHSGEYYRVETTGAIVTLNSSVALIYRYCSQLPADRYFKSCPRFDIDEERGFCILRLPKSCPIPPVKVHGQTDVLKQSACLVACKRLHEVGALTDYLLPLTEDAEDDASMGSGGEPCEEFHAMYFPQELIGHLKKGCGKELYDCYSITLHSNVDHGWEFRSLLLMVKCNLGYDFEQLSFVMGPNQVSVAVNMGYAGTRELDVEQVLMARRFQTTIFKILITGNVSEMRESLERLNQGETCCTQIEYLLLPSIGSGFTSSQIDWDSVRSASALNPDRAKNYQKCHCSPKSNAHFVRLTNGTSCDCLLRNSLVLTPHNGKIYYISSILHDMDGNSPMKQDRKHGAPRTYKEYFKWRHDILLQHEMEPLLLGRHLFKVQNWLLKHPCKVGTEAINATVELPPELCCIIMFPISISTIYTFSLVPSIMHRIEAFLLAAQLKRTIVGQHARDLNIPIIKVLECLTTKKCQEEFSLESLETLGDSFLKSVACQHLFMTYENHHEGLLSSKKDKMVSNATLYRLGCDRELSGYIRNESFDPQTWSSPGDCLPTNKDHKSFSLSSKKTYVKGQKKFKAKVVADVVEALIGAFLSTNGEQAALLFMDWMGIKVDIFKDPLIERPHLLQPERFVNVSLIETLLKYKFHDCSLLVEALTHGSYQVEDTLASYQRLEFLGDSVLDYLLTKHFYNMYPRISPQLLTDLRSASVNNYCYAHVAVKAGLHKHILYASSELHSQIASSIKCIKDLSLSASMFGWEADTEFPKVLGDVIESIAGAILVDSGFNKEVVWRSIRPILEPLVTLETVKIEPVRELEELCSKRSYKKEKSFSVADGLTYATFTVKVDGVSYSNTCSARNRKMAKKFAAKALLETMKASIPGL
ncbi:endoribonuclease Dicer homolog 2 isoform X1 [Amborella trichopoda]|uniref:endoribonuclease Dicer homolog 2 isoform X1 n=1 Tax=Amborella trichopoda TaxID=13333 RepID=UPI0009C0D982|nr:endoribonuclease Dicer homolog 2 isoform X1 [Amborella trichopoda]|eukprot:XP_011623569.2 endoribonuclease Dicer homolog 2 isoform X1 [Amborella trichopoda]